MDTIVVMTEDTLTDHDVQRLMQLHDASQVTFHVTVPSGTDQSVLDELVDDVAETHFKDAVEDLGDEERDLTPAEIVARARRHLNASIAKLVAAGATADGELVPRQPVDAVARIALARDAVEVDVVTEPHIVTDTLRRDWATRLRHELKKQNRSIPVLHFIVGTDQVVG